MCLIIYLFIYIKEVYVNIGSHIKAQGQEDGQYERWLFQVLTLSYQELPYQLKTCFLYLGQYPKDFNIEIEQLYQLWIAEGIISVSKEDQRSREETVMGVPDRHSAELAQRYMVQVKLEKDHPMNIKSTRFKSCQLHDLVRE